MQSRTDTMDQVTTDTQMNAPPPVAGVGGANPALVLRAGDQPDWAVIYRTVAPQLHAWATRMCRSSEQAADIVHDAFARTMQALAVPDRDINVRPYLFATAHNLLRDSFTRDSRAQPLGSADEVDLQRAGVARDGDAAADSMPERSALEADEARNAADALAALPERMRAVVLLCDMEECSYAEAGSVLGINANAVAQLLLRARTRLRLEFRVLHTDTATLSSACSNRLAAISKLVDDELRQLQRDALEAHISECTACERVRSDFETARLRVRAIATLPLPFGVPELDLTAGWEWLSSHVSVAGVSPAGNDVAGGGATGSSAPAVAPWQLPSPFNAAASSLGAGAGAMAMPRMSSAYSFFAGTRVRVRVRVTAIAVLLVAVVTWLVFTSVTDEAAVSRPEVAGAGATIVSSAAHLPDTSAVRRPARTHKRRVAGQADEPAGTFGESPAGQVSGSNPGSTTGNAPPTRQPPPRRKRPAAPAGQGDAAAPVPTPATTAPAPEAAPTPTPTTPDPVAPPTVGPNDPTGPAAPPPKAGTWPILVYVGGIIAPPPPDPAPIL